MRVFCPEHKRGFFAPRQSPIKCGNRGHILGELDFHGETKSPLEPQWQYCCNCEHFCPVDFAQDGLEHCPVCTRRSSVLYLCDRCFCISFESNTPLQTKNFTLTSEGIPQPSCPACLRKASVDLREHICERVNASFVTALNSCPICSERLDIGPSFPASVAHYLRRTKTANKLNVTFDYEDELFVPVEDGEFVLINNGGEAFQSLVLPRAASFTTAQDFYEFYQDFYHCPDPNAGEVQILEPATVVRAAEGWRLQAPGVLEVMVDQARKPATVLPPTREGPATSRTFSPDAVSCTQCGTLIESRYGFCWQCGSELISGNKISGTHSEKSVAPVPSPVMVLDDDEQTVQHELRRITPPIFSWMSANGPQHQHLANGSLLKLLGLAVIGLVLVTLGVLWATRSNSEIASVTAAQALPSPSQPDPSITGNQVATPDDRAQPTPQRNPAQHPGDYELKRLREKRIAATRSERPEILQMLARTEKKYPKDYRFPYERAKLVVKGRQSSSRDEAFAALSEAAEKAISTGKAREMLENLRKDSRGDFQKLSHGRREWSQLQEALKNQDARVLSERMGM